jgi:serine/threonine-protein kinase/endoribonuclease IRE1
LKRFCEDKDFSLGRGSLGTNVYVGIMDDGSLVAVKRMLTDRCEELAENEIAVLNLIETERSPFVVQYRQFLKRSTFMYLILDLCEESLDEHVKTKSIEYLKEYGPGMIEQILSGLEFLHYRNILHRDLKPLNVLVDIAGRMKLADFGLSRVLSDEETTVDTFGKGTEEWMAPEVIEARNGMEKGRFKRKSDVHAAGMIAFFILTKGEHPFGGKYDRVKNILEGKASNLEILEDREANDFISCLIHRNIDDRPYSGEALEYSFLNQVKNYEELPQPRISLVDADNLD